MKVEIEKQRITDCIEKMCEDYCIWPVQATSDESLENHCDECPLNNIYNDDYWENQD